MTRTLQRNTGFDGEEVGQFYYGKRVCDDV